MPSLAAFPKAELAALCTPREQGGMALADWFALVRPLGLDGVELYPGIVDLHDPASWPATRGAAAEIGVEIPMFCCSPDFTHPDPGFRAREVEKEKGWIGTAEALGAKFCRVLSGQRRPEVSRDEGIDYAAACIRECLPYAADRGITLVLENHYKDAHWLYPEFAQHTDVFCDLVDAIDSPGFGVNFDPSNTILAGEDPLVLLERVKHRVASMHASDRYLKHGSLEDLAAEEGVEGYASRLAHGEIGQGLNDYDSIFSTLRGVGFDSWVSIEDGVDGFDQLERSVQFLRRKIADHFPGSDPA